MRGRSLGVKRNPRRVRTAAVEAVGQTLHVIERLEDRILLSVVRFTTQANLVVGNTPEAVLSTDVNGDGKMDLVTANYYSSSVSVLLGNGNGTFKPEQEFSTGKGAESVVAGDFNSDHKADLAVADSGDGTVAILLGNGNGTFGAPAFITVGNFPQRIATADVNLDQKPDLFVTATGSHGITQLLGNGNGTFLQSQVAIATQASVASTLQPLAIAAMDLTNDNRPELIVTISNKSTVGVLVNIGNAFAPAVTFDAGINPNEIGLADFNGDGFTDVAIPSNSAGSNFVSVLLGNGNGTLRARQTFFTGYTSPSSVAVADFNGDGKPDLAVADYTFKAISILLNDGGGSFPAPQKFGTTSNPSPVIAPDLDGDGKPDLAFVQGYAGSVGTMLNTSQPFVVSINRKTPTSATTSVQVLSFTVTFNTTVTGVDATDFVAQGIGVSSGTISVTPVSGSVYTVMVSGVSGNGRLGLNLVNNSSIHDLTGQALQSTPLSFSLQQTVAFGPTTSMGMVLKDVNGDTRPDVVTTLGGEVGVALGNGNGTFQPGKTFAGGTSAYGLAIADVNGDGKQDVIVPNNNGNYSGTVGLLLGNGNGTLHAQVTFAAPKGYAPTGVAVADINGDGKPDLVVNNASQEKVGTPYGYNYVPANVFTVMLGNGNGTFKPVSAAVEGATGIGYNAAPVLADLNGDGKVDLAVARSDYNTVTRSFTTFADVLLGNGNGTFQAAHAYTFGTSRSPQQLVLADVNGDGKSDLLLPVGGRMSVLLGNGNGTFRNAITSQYAGYAPVAVVDVNGDGKPDVLAGGAYGFSVSFGAGDGTFGPGPAFMTRQRIYAFAAVELNGDGKTDIVTEYTLPSSPFFTGVVAVLLGGTTGVVSGQSYAVIPPVDNVTGTGVNDTMSLTRDADGVDIDLVLGGFTTQFPVNDSHGLTFNGNGGNDAINLNYANGNPLPNLMHLNGTFTINGLSGASPLATTQLDIAKSTVYFSYAGSSPASVIVAALTLGYNGGAWNGSGGGVITSNAAASGPAGVFGVGYADSADGVVGGQPANTVEIRYTVMGDVTLDRVVNSTDGILLARNYLIAGRSNWDQGNFNFDTTINLSDAQILQKNYNATASGSVTSGVSTGSTVTTPILQNPTTGQGSGTSGSDAGGSDLTTTKKHHKKRHH